MALEGAVDKIVDRLALRDRMLRIAPFQTLREGAVARRRAAFRAEPLDARIQLVLASLIGFGIAELPGLDMLGLAGADALFAGLAQRGAAAWNWPDTGPLFETQAILDLAPSLYLVGLDPALLALAEGYLGEPCFYMGCSMKREPVSDALVGVRRWHSDIEDDRMLRMIVYLNTVEPGGGAFEYLDRETSADVRRRLGYHTGYVSDEAMAELVPADQWRQVHAPVGSVLFFDGRAVFHRVQRPRAAERFSISYTFTTRHPRQMLRPVRLHRRGVAALAPVVTERQRACIPAPRLL